MSPILILSHRRAKLPRRVRKLQHLRIALLGLTALWRVSRGSGLYARWVQLRV
jgi:hypothetical protein